MPYTTLPSVFGSQHSAISIQRSAFSLLLLFLTSCSTINPTPSSTPIPSSTASPTETPTPLPTETSTPTLVPAPARATYTLNTTIDYYAHIVSVDETIVYPNHTDQTLDSLVLAVVPNLWVNCFTIQSMAVDGTPVNDYTVTGQRLDLNLPALLGPELTTTLSIQYTLALPFAEQEDPGISRPRIFGYTRAQLNLTNWYPFVVPFINDDWVLHEPWFYGEHLVYDAADFDVNLKFTDPANPPVVAASGAPEPNGETTRYRLTAGRAFAIAASDQFIVSTLQIGDVVLSSYYFPLNGSAGEIVLQETSQALQIFSERYGPYPHKTLAIVMGDFNDGMEYSALFYLSRDFYNLYNGTPDNYLITVAAHETAHQWWFEQVANDQATQPWLDESLSTYSERVFYEARSPNSIRDWWRPVRVDFYQPQGFVDIPIYDGQGFQPYTNAVYFRGAYFLEDLRARVGDETFFAFIRDYRSQYNGRIATARDFFAVLSQHTQIDYSDLVRQYFQNVY
jgi:hypothetical protein